MPPERGALRRVLVAVTALAFLLLLAGFGARLHPAGDTIGVFRVPADWTWRNLRDFLQKTQNCSQSTLSGDNLAR